MGRIIEQDRFRAKLRGVLRVGGEPKPPDIVAAEQPAAIVAPSEPPPPPQPIKPFVPKPPVLTPRRAISMRRLGRFGQWGNQVIQYAFVRIYAHKYGLDYAVHPWVGRYLYGFDDPAPDKHLPPLVEPYIPGNKYNPCFGGPIEPNGDEWADRDFQGWAQFHTAWYAPHADFIRRLYAEPIEPQLNRVRTALAKLRRRGDTIIGLHLRRGDSGRMIFPFTPIEWCLRWLWKNWRRFRRPVLLLCTQDDTLLPHFAGYKSVTHHDLGIVHDGVPYPGYPYQFKIQRNTPEQMDFFPDWYLLQHCDVLLASDSSFAITAALASRTVRELWRPRLSLRDFELLDPYNMPFCNREHLDDYPGIPGTQIDVNPDWEWGDFKPTFPSVPEDPAGLRKWSTPP